MATIGFIGLGNMGAPMAANLVRAGHRVLGYDVNQDTMRPLVSAGGQAATDATAGTRGAEFVITMLPAGEHVREALPLRDWGIDLRAIDGPIGAASGVKMSYAGITKGTTAIAAAMRTGTSADALLAIERRTMKKG